VKVRRKILIYERKRTTILQSIANNLKTMKKHKPLKFTEKYSNIFNYFSDLRVWGDGFNLLPSFACFDSLIGGLFCKALWVM